MIPDTMNGLPAMACISAMQKAIRRGMEREAMEFAVELMHTSKAFHTMVCNRLEDSRPDLARVFWINLIWPSLGIVDHIADVGIERDTRRLSRGHGAPWLGWRCYQKVPQEKQKRLCVPILHFFVLVTPPYDLCTDQHKIKCDMRNGKYPRTGLSRVPRFPCAAQRTRTTDHHRPAVALIATRLAG
jgi:hypothetical protein